MKKRTILFLAAALWMGGLSAACADALVSLRPVAEVQGPAIRLSDVFEGLPLDMDRDIALAPEPGKSVTYDAGVLTRLAEQYRLIWRAQSLADASVLTRAAVAITPEMVQEKILKKIMEIESAASSGEILFDGKYAGLFLSADQEPSFEIGAFDYNASSRRFRAEVVSSGKPALRQSVSGRVVLRQEIPVLSSRLLGGTIIGASDLSWRSEEKDRLARDIVTDASKIIGMELRSDVEAGEPVRDRNLMPPRLVTRGAFVTLEVKTPLMQVSVRGRALQDGAKGDVVRVTNLQSKRIVEGTVEADGIVRVDIAPKAVVTASAERKE